MNIEGEPGAYRKVHAGFGEEHPETACASTGWRRMLTLLAAAQQLLSDLEIVETVYGFAHYLALT